MMDRRYGWRPDLPDFRDRRYSAKRRRIAGMPSVIDLRPQCPPVYDQGQLGSCSSNAVAGAIEFERKKQGLPDFVPSRLYVYYNTRVIEGDPEADNGAQIRDAIKAVAVQGACPETDWPYDISKFAVAPPANCYADAKTDLVSAYARVDQTATAIKNTLISGKPVVFGITVYDSFESDAVAQSGIVPMPSSSESAQGGHAMLCVGYDEPNQVFIVRNSWGAYWGRAGYCTIPYAYMLNGDLACDFWVVEAIGGQP